MTLLHSPNSSKYHVFKRVVTFGRWNYYLTVCGSRRYFQDSDGYKYFTEHDEKEITDSSMICKTCARAGASKNTTTLLQNTL